MKKSCKSCNQEFVITDEDLAFYEQVSPEFGGKKFQIPPPGLCPDCRMKRRLVWRAELHLFKRKSDLSGRTILSQYPQSAPYKIYSEDEWWSDDWDPLKYGRDFDFSRPFFEQFDELLREVPIMARAVASNENCDYVNNVGYCKNCYLIAGASYNEDCFYGNFLYGSKDCMDICNLTDCELCYECVDCKNCYNVRFSQHCENCRDSSFLFNCKNSKNCFGSVNLVGKEYVFINEQLTKEEYEKRLKDLHLETRSGVLRAQKMLEEHRLKYPHKYMIGEMNENVTGNTVSESRNSSNCFEASELEDCKYCTRLQKGKNCMDIYAFGLSAEECYECVEVGYDSHRCCFNATLLGANNVFYSYYCYYNSDLFGCISLRHKKYCILNKQYTKEEYEELVSRVIEHMKKTGEWGEFFPMGLSPMAYNQTVAQDNYPLRKEEALRLGAKWNDDERVDSPAEKVEVPDSISDVDESICDKVLTCEETGKPFKIIPQEFEFYKKMGIPVPVKNFEARHRARLALRNPRRLWDRKCDNCGVDLRSSYSPERRETVYCEECYLGEVY